MVIGGLRYTAVPFNGWYANTEVLRDLTDEGRYNMLKPVGTALGIDVDEKPGEAPMWKDEVMHILSSAVYHSFRASKVAMIDHHTLTEGFWNWYQDEMKTRKYCPANYKWIIPPMSSSLSQAYLGLNKAQEYTINPAYVYGRSAFQLEKSYFGQRDTSKATDMFVRAVYIAMLLKKCVKKMREHKHPVLIIYASVTGNAAKYASDLGALLRSVSNVSFFDACRGDALGMDRVLQSLQSATLTIFVSSTQGNGELPSQSSGFFSLLFDKHGSTLSGKQCAVLGFGSSAYPIFCGAAQVLSKKLAEAGAREIIRRGECDAVKGEVLTFQDWTTKLVAKMSRLNSASRLWSKLLDNMKESAASSLARRKAMLSSVEVEVFNATDVKKAAAESFMSARRGSLGSAMSRSRRRSSMGSGRRLSLGSATSEDEEAAQSRRLTKIILSSGINDAESKYLEGEVKSREDLISYAPLEGEGESVSRKTSLIKIDLQSCGNPPYQPGDHIRVFPRNVISLEELQSFVGHLGERVELDDHIWVSFDKAKTLGDQSSLYRCPSSVRALAV
ncbi:hypothetical protein ACHAXT_011111 [Thalassiosira profunda]